MKQSSTSVSKKEKQTKTNRAWKQKKGASSCSHSSSRNAGTGTCVSHGGIMCCIRVANKRAAGRTMAARGHTIGEHTQSRVHTHACQAQPKKQANRQSNRTGCCSPRTCWAPTSRAAQTRQCRHDITMKRKRTDLELVGPPLLQRSNHSRPAAPSNAANMLHCTCLELVGPPLLQGSHQPALAAVPAAAAVLGKRLLHRTKAKDN